MKWIVVILVLLNIVAYLLGLKIQPGENSSVDNQDLKTVNAASMSVLSPAKELTLPTGGDAVEGTTLEEDELAQLKVDKRGQVLRAPSSEKREDKKEQMVKVTEQKAASSAEKESANKPAASQTNVKTEKVPQPEPEAIPAPAEKPQAKVVKADPTPEPVPAVKQEPAPAPAQAQQNKVTLACYRIGPFTNQNKLADVRRKLESGGLKYKLDDRSDSKKIRAVRVYLGAYADNAALNAEKQQLKKMAIDHYVVSLNGSQVLQLGYFSEPARGAAYQKVLKGKGLDAKTDTIYQEAVIESWIDLPPVSDELIKSLRIPQGVKVAEQACRQ